MSALLASCAWLCACSRAPAPVASVAPGAAAAPEAAAVREVRTATAVLVPWERTLPVFGSLAAFDEATIGAKVPGRLTELAVDLGSPVRAGDVVARIDRRDYELGLAAAQAALQQARARLGLSAQGDDDDVDPEATALVRQARAVLAEAQASRERVVGLRAEKVTSQSEVDVAEAAFRVAESKLQDALEEIESRRAELLRRRAELAVASAALEDTAIVAPFDGVTLERIAGLGNYLRAGDPIARVARVDPLRLRLEVPERESALVRVGQPVRLLLESGGEPYTGKIARISPAIGKRNRALLVEAEVPNPAPLSEGDLASMNGSAVDLSSIEWRPAAGTSERRLRPGAFVRAEIVIDEAAQAVSVPSSAVASFAGIDKVIAVEDGKAVEKRVTLGRRDGERVEIQSGLEAGAEVVLSPGSLSGGTPVKPGQ